MADTPFAPFGPRFDSHPGVECQKCGCVVTMPRIHELFHERLDKLAARLEQVESGGHTPPGQAKKP